MSDVCVRGNERVSDGWVREKDGERERERICE